MKGNLEKEKTNDDNLYTAYLAGDTSAYDRLMIKYGDSLTMYLRKRGCHTKMMIYKRHYP